MQCRTPYLYLTTEAGRCRFRIFRQSLNAPFSTNVIPSGMSTTVSLVHPENVSRTIPSIAGDNLTAFRFLQSVKAFKPKCFTEAGIITSIRFWQFWNAPSPISSIPSGSRSILFVYLPMNAASPIVFTPSGITVVRHPITSVLPSFVSIAFEPLGDMYTGFPSSTVMLSISLHP